MAGSVGVNVGREGVEVAWETGEYEGPVIIKAVNAENGDVGISKVDNDGYHFLTWPPGDYVDHISVYQDVDGEQGDLIAEGDISVHIGD